MHLSTEYVVVSYVVVLWIGGWLTDFMAFCWQHIGGQDEPLNLSLHRGLGKSSAYPWHLVDDSREDHLSFSPSIYCKPFNY